MPFLGSALRLTAMCSLGWGNLVAFDWNDLPVGREFDCKFLEKVKSPPHALPPPHCQHYIDRCIKLKQTFHLILLCFHHRKCAKSHKQSPGFANFIDEWSQCGFCFTNFGVILEYLESSITKKKAKFRLSSTWSGRV